MSVETMTAEQLEALITSKQAIGLSVVEEQAELTSRRNGQTDYTTGKGATMSEESGRYTIDQEGFESGGITYRAPMTAGLYRGFFAGTDTPEKFANKGQLWLNFSTSDPGLEKEGQATGAIIIQMVARGGAQSGAWKLRQILNNLNVPYSLNQGHISFNIPTDLPVVLDWAFNENTQDIRIRDVRLAGTVQGVIG